MQPDTTASNDMRRVRHGDLLSVQQGIIVHGCNARGVMGSGVAAQVKQKYPAAYEEYKRHDGKYQLGMIIPALVAPNLVIINAITQKDYGRIEGRLYADYDAIKIAFEQIAQIADESGMEVHYPQIGAGLAQGDWRIISLIIDKAFEPYPNVDRTLWVYQG